MWQGNMSKVYSPEVIKCGSRLLLLAGASGLYWWERCSRLGKNLCQFVSKFTSTIWERRVN